MFDADTIELMSHAPLLEGVNLAELPQRLTAVYAGIVSARIRLRQYAQSGTVPKAVASEISELRRLAFAHEAFVSVLDSRDNRSASAFVAATAHHVTLLAEALQNDGPRASRLGGDGISPEVSAALLFLIAESAADASEMAKRINVESADVVTGALMRAIRHLARGELGEIENIPLPAREEVLATDLPNQAVRALYLILLHGARALAAQVLRAPATFPGELEAPKAILERAKRLCVEPFGELAGDLGAGSDSVYPGPLHLAALLSALADNLPTVALMAVEPPSGVDSERWFSALGGIARQRPYLWRNHREAVNKGYLEAGVSAAISFPTGAGKSTLAELKIAATLLRGSKVVFLAPTLALVDQTANALAGTFPASEVERQRGEELAFEIAGDPLPAISVMTPERCLAMLSFEPEIFADSGLLVFDECHLMHPRDAEANRRAVDAMLCVLSFTAVAPHADLLFLSAMMSNTDEIAGWLGTLTGRSCLALSLGWKPTRQVRGCMVYRQGDIALLEKLLRRARVKVPNKNAPATLARMLTAQPFGLFCLKQTWQSNARQDYSLLPILDDSVTLSTGTSHKGGWYLTPNGNQVATTIAAATARRGLKTLLFAQSIPLTNRAATDLSELLGPHSGQLTIEEQRLHEIAVDELGGDEATYIDASADGRLISSCVCHHGLLLPAERRLHESLFKRPDGINVLVATSTLAQGMNLPSEVVIISGDSRFGIKSSRMTQLEAHELLNAAGRAGRAGDSSYGFVLVVPSKVVHFNNETSEIHNHWGNLQAIFAQSDQCLEIDDPFTALLDQIHNDSTHLSPTAAYFVSRLPVDGPAEQGTDASARRVILGSFAAYRSKVRSDDSWIAERLQAVLSARRTTADLSTPITWADRAAAASGVPASILQELGSSIESEIALDSPMQEWYDWFVTWLAGRPHLLPSLIRSESLGELFGSAYKALTGDEERGRFASPQIFALLARWVQGDSLIELEREFGTDERRIGKCESARKFALRIVPELAYLFGLPHLVARNLTGLNSPAGVTPAALVMLGAAVREGFDTLEKIALRHSIRAPQSRRAIHRRFGEIQAHLDPPAIHEDFEAVKARVKRAIRSAETTL